MSILNDIGDSFKEAGKFMADKTSELSEKAKNSIEKSLEKSSITAAAIPRRSLIFRTSLRR